MCPPGGKNVVLCGEAQISKGGGQRGEPFLGRPGQEIDVGPKGLAPALRISHKGGAPLAQRGRKSPLSESPEPKSWFLNGAQI